jgi:hypothetical protein
VKVRNLSWACGNAGNPSMVRLTVSAQSNDYDFETAGANLAISLGGTQYAVSAIPAGSAINAATIGASSGAIVDPGRMAGNFMPTTITIDIPCTNVPGDSDYTLQFLVNGADDFALRSVEISSCMAETCGNQGIVCPGLKTTKACTPGTPKTRMNHNVQGLGL